MLEDKLMATNVFSLLIQDPGWGSIIINNQSLRGTEPGQPIGLHEPRSPPNSGWSRIHRAVITNDKCSFRQLHDWILTKHHFNLRLHCLTVDRAVTVKAAIHNVAFKNQWIHRQDWQPLLASTHSAYKKKQTSGLLYMTNHRFIRFAMIANYRLLPYEAGTQSHSDSMNTLTGC